MSDYRFKLGMSISELNMPFDKSLAKAKEIGADYVWLNLPLDGGPPVAQMTDAQVDDIAERVRGHGLEIFLVKVNGIFKQVHLSDLELEGMEDQPLFRKELDDLISSMRIASRLGVATVSTFTFAWPGEYTAGKPTWPMRWLTRGGHIADVDMEKLEKAFSLMIKEAERYDVDIALSMMPWNYTNTTANFRRVAERLDSKRIKVIWGPADNYNCGELDVATVGFNNLMPYLHGLHLKDLHVNNGLLLDFDYRPFGEGDVDYETVLRNLRDHDCDVVLSVATHFVPASGSPEEAMRINYKNLKEIIRKVEEGGGENNGG